MARSDGSISQWGTLEDLVLAFAVRRYGDGNWAAVSEELLSRSIHIAAPDYCRRRFALLRLRFNDTDPAEHVRLLRIDDLRRQLRLSDASIASLESKVKRLEEARDLAAAVISGGETGSSCGESNSTAARHDDSTDTNSCAAFLLDDVSLAQKGSSDGQSSATFTRRRGRRLARMRNVTSGSSSEISEPYQPFVGAGAEKRLAPSGLEKQLGFLHYLRSSEPGSVFSTRLPSQDFDAYNLLIKRHVDLEIVRSRLQDGTYVDPLCFFRDLLLLCANAVTFYPKSFSREYHAAVRLRSIIIDEMASTFGKERRCLSPPVVTPAAHQQSSKLECVAMLNESSGQNTEICRVSGLGSVFTCRKRSSITKKHTAALRRSVVDTDERMLLSEEQTSAGRSRRMGNGVSWLRQAAVNRICHAKTADEPLENHDHASNTSNSGSRKGRTSSATALRDSKASDAASIDNKTLVEILQENDRLKTFMQNKQNSTPRRILSKQKHSDGTPKKRGRPRKALSLSSPSETLHCRKKAKENLSYGMRSTGKKKPRRKLI